MKKAYAKPRRFLVVDDDPLFIKILANVATGEGMIIDGFASLENVVADMDPEFYDAAIVDYDLGDWTGVQAVECLRSRLGAMPVLLVSQTHRKAIGHEVWPPSIQKFLEKSRGCEAILHEAKKLSERYVA